MASDEHRCQEDNCPNDTFCGNEKRPVTREEALGIGGLYCAIKFPYTNDRDGRHLAYDVLNTADEIMRGEQKHLVAIYMLGRSMAERRLYGYQMMVPLKLAQDETRLKAYAESMWRDSGSLKGLVLGNYEMNVREVPNYIDPDTGKEVDMSQWRSVLVEGPIIGSADVPTDR